MLIFSYRCEPFPTYPRTYDMLHANGLLSHMASERCSMRDLFLEMDRILRPEVYLIYPCPFVLLEHSLNSELILCCLGWKICLCTLACSLVLDSVCYFSSYCFHHELIKRYYSVKIVNSLDGACRFWCAYFFQGWVVLSDKVGTIEMARMLAGQIRWEARVIDLQNGSDQRLLVCQKLFLKKWLIHQLEVSPVQTCIILCLW